MAKEELEEKPEGQQKKESPVGFLVVLALITLVAVGAGWFLGGLLVHPPSGSENAAKPAENLNDTVKSDQPLESETKNQYSESGPLLVLDPIIVTLRKSNNVFLRLELAVVGGNDASFNEATKLKIGSEVAAFAQTLTLQQISGPSGYLHFREDILDRARLSTEGQVKDVYIISMVAE